MERGKVFIQDKTGRIRMIGMYDDKNGIFMSRRSSAKHKMIGRNEWGINKQVLDELAQAKARVRIIDTDTGAEYWSPAEVIQQEARVGGYAGQERQYFMELDKWEKRSR